MRDPRDSKGQRRAALIKAEQLLQQIGANLQSINCERFQSDAAEPTAFDWVRCEIKKVLPRPN